MRRVAIALLLLLPIVRASDVRADDDLEIPGLQAPDLRGDALVWEDGTFYLEPWEGGANVRFGSFGRGRREEVGRAIPVRIVGAVTRTFLEVVLTPELDCAPRRVFTDPRLTGLRLFVKRDDLAPVLTRPYADTNSDGTGVRLSPGVPVVPTASGLYAVSLRGDRLRFPIPHASVGYIYTRGKVSEPERPKTGLVRIERMSALKLGGDPVEIRTPWLVPRPDKPAPSHLVKLTERCFELTVSVSSDAMRPYSWTPPYRSYEPTGYEPRLSHRVLRGAPLATPGGREVAVAAGIIEVAAPVAGSPACFEARLTMYRLEEPPGSLARTTRLCAAAEHVDGPPTAEVTKVSASPTTAPPDVARPPPSARRTANGVWYRVLASGAGGRSPRPADKVKVHYTGWTTDGKMFDSSYTRGTPIVFPLSGLIPGWVEGMQVMTIGMKTRFWIPEELAYKGVPGRPAGMLVFDVELLGIE
jgi:hypothetical protein